VNVAMTRDILTGLMALAFAIGLVIVGTVLLGKRKLLPLDRRVRRVPWDWPELIVIAIAWLGIQVLVFLSLEAGGVYRRLYGANPDTTNQALDAKLLTARCVLLATVIAAPLVVAAILGVIVAIRQTPLRLLGIWRWRWRENITLAYLCCIILVPTCFLIHIGSEHFHEIVLKQPPRPHPLEQIFTGDATPAEWVLLVVQAVVLAPIVEEVLFRGVVLPWLAKRAWGGAAACAVALAFTLLQIDLSQDGYRLGISLIPAVFVVIASGIGLAATAREPGPDWRWRGILGSSLVFAMMHAEAWPSPIALVVLAFALGWLAQRTRSLIGPIVLHALFNAVSTLMLLRGWKVLF
jgi:membrane protease YdiL (CAAX protease family)